MLLLFRPIGRKHIRVSMRSVAFGSSMNLEHLSDTLNLSLEH